MKINKLYELFNSIDCCNYSPTNSFGLYKIVETDSNKYDKNEWKLVCNSKIMNGCVKQPLLKNVTRNSNSSSERSLAEDTSSSDEETKTSKKANIKPKCLLKIKKD